MRGWESRARLAVTDLQAQLYSKKWIIWNKATEYLLYSASFILWCGHSSQIIEERETHKRPYLCSHGLNIFKVASVLLKHDGPLVEEPLERHIQGRVMRGLTAQHHALPHRHLHPVGAELHTHGICKHNAAALSPQANPDRPSWCSIWLWATRKSKKGSPNRNKQSL